MLIAPFPFIVVPLAALRESRARKSGSLVRGASALVDQTALLESLNGSPPVAIA
jgi:hypothetical protein